MTASGSDALIVLDAATPLLERLGSGATPALARAADLLTAARDAGTPVLHARLRFRADGLDGGHYLRRNPDLRVCAGADAPSYPPLAPSREEVVVPHAYPSAFAGTSIAPTLRGVGCDTVVLVGVGTTTGVRATAIDAMQHGFDVVVVEDGVADAAPGLHRAALEDLAAHYADVLDADQVGARWIRTPSPARSEGATP